MQTPREIQTTAFLESAKDMGDEVMIAAARSLVIANRSGRNGWKRPELAAAVEAFKAWRDQ